MDKLSTIPRYIACARHIKRPIFAFVDSAVHPGDALQVFPLADDYSFGVLQSDSHWVWFQARCSTIKREPRYTSNTVYDSFPWPQSPSPDELRAVARAAVSLREVRQELLEQQRNSSLRELYRTLDIPGLNRLRERHKTLDATVRAAYGMKRRHNALEFLFSLNQELAESEATLRPVQYPGLPASVTDADDFVSSDCITLQNS